MVADTLDLHTTCSTESTPHTASHRRILSDTQHFLVIQREHTLQNTKRWSRIRSTRMRLASTEQRTAHHRPNSPVVAASVTFDAYDSVLCVSPAPQRLSSNRRDARRFPHIPLFHPLRCALSQEFTGVVIWKCHQYLMA